MTLKFKNIQYDTIMGDFGGPLPSKELYQLVPGTKGVHSTALPNGKVIINISNSIQESIDIVTVYNKTK